jgi:hypothetical protein
MYIQVMDNDYIHCINELYLNDEIKSKYSYKMATILNCCLIIIMIICHHCLMDYFVNSDNTISVLQVVRLIDIFSIAYDLTLKDECNVT